MLGEDLKELTESILDGDVLDEDFFLQLANIAKETLEAERMWSYLKVVDASQSVAQGNNASVPKVLPSDFAEDYLVQIGSGFVEAHPVSFEEQFKYRNSANRYYVDVAGGNYYILGNTPGGTIYFFYKKITDAITLTTAPTFPARFHPIIAFMVAGYIQVGVDADDIYARMSPENKAQALQIRANMIQWDTNIKARAQDNRVGVADADSADVPLEIM